ncbi:MAG: multiheme c-type cytochrome [Acidobacteriota bacterium]
MPRFAARAGLSVAALVLLAASGMLPSATGGQTPAAQSPQEPAPQYVGISRCAAGLCHGSAEQATWQDRDRHSGAYSVLLQQQSQSIARILGIGPAEQSGQCLDCHAVNAAPQRRDPRFQISDGVGCEACHGPASRWIQDHYAEGQGAPSRSDLLQRGMVDTKNLQLRARLCLSCHLGDEQKSVTHRLIAAGHPELAFDLDTFVTRMPPHWEAPHEPGYGARQWAVGQATALAMSLRQLARRLEADAFIGWPDFADFECSSCHHPYPSQQRQQRGDEGRPGIPPLNPARRLVFRRFVEAALPGQSGQIDSGISELHQALEGLGKDPSRTAQAARQLAATVDQLIPRLSSADFGDDTLRTVIQALHSEAGSLSGAGVRSAEQLRWAVDALYASMKASSGSDAAIEALIEEIGRNLQRRYPQAFASQEE